MSRTKFFFKVFFATFLLGAVIGVGFVACNFLGMTTFEAEFNINDFTLPHTTTVVITDENGTEHEWFQMYDKDREPVSINEMPQALKDAIVCIEDERFYYHNGVDFVGTAKAFLNYAVGKRNAPGGSTITQQLVKNLTNNDEVEWQRKFTEILRAMNVENNASKEEILEMYLNTVYFGNGAYGIKSAAKTYFNKNPQDLTTLECASIAGLTQNPGGYDPFREDRKEAFTNRRNAVLSKMLEFNKITKEEYDEYIKTETVFVNRNDDSVKTASSRYAYEYFEDKLVKDLKEDLMEAYHMSYEEATDYLRTGGLKVYSTLDPIVQDSIDDVYQSYAAAKDAQSAIVVIDPESGAIRGMAGGFGKIDGSGIARNRVYDDPRQPGSTIKPVAVYAPAIEMGVISPATQLDDSPYTTPAGTTIKNYDNSYDGKMSAKYALQKSKNPTAMQVLDKVGINNSYNYLKDKFHFSTLDDRDKAHSPLALGGLTNGMRVDELTAAYATFVNGGMYYEPYTYTHVVDYNGNIILDNRNNKGKRAISESTAFIMMSLLQSVVDSPNGTGRNAVIPSAWSLPVGGKTGTTDADKDRWFIGLTPHYVGAIWYGYDDRRTVYASGNPCVTLWKSVMNNVYSAASSQKKSEKFYDNKVPSGVEGLKVCSQTGFLATETCPSTEIEYFKKGVYPTEMCLEHMEVPEETDEETTEGGENTENGENNENSDNSSDDSSSSDTE